jgi:hypothetical protein
MGMLGLWGILVVLGLRILWSYKSTPGEFGRPASAWPAASQLKLDPTRPTLVMAAHPKCPCTRASIGELARLMSKVSGQLKAYVVFIRPVSLPEGWEKTDLWQSAARIPGVTAVRDDLGQEAALFGAQTSGHTFLYDVRGNLLFSGGITAARGHAGDSAGQDLVLSLVRGNKNQGATAAVFGCGLFSQGERP